MPLGGEYLGLQVEGDFTMEGQVSHPLDQLHDDVIANLAQRLRHALLGTRELFNLVVLCNAQQSVFASQLSHERGVRGGTGRGGHRCCHGVPGQVSCRRVWRVNGCILPHPTAARVHHVPWGRRLTYGGTVQTVSVCLRVHVSLTDAVALGVGHGETAHLGAAIGGDGGERREVGVEGLGGGLGVEVGVMEVGQHVAGGWAAQARVHLDAVLGKALLQSFLCRVPPLVLLVLHLQKMRGFTV